MDTETVRLKMQGQVDDALRSAMVGAYKWEFEIDDLIVYVTFRPRRRPERVFLLRVMFGEFPRRAPSYVFVDRSTNLVTDQAWPPDVKHGDDALPGICTPGTREFHEKWHRTDAQWPWDPDRLTFLDTLQRIQAIMEKGVA